MEKRFFWLNEWILAVCLFAALGLLCIFTGFNGLYGQDAFEYERFSTALKDFISSGTEPGSFFWPVNYPLAGALFSFVTGSSAFSLLLISMLSHCLVFVLAFRILLLISPEQKQLKLIFAFCFVGLSPILLRHSVLVMSDSFSLLCLISGLYFASLFSAKGKSVHAGIAAASLCCAVMTRYAAAVPALFPMIIIALAWFKKPSWKAVVFILFCGVIMLVPHLLLNGKHPTEFTGHAWLTGWSPLNFFQDTFQNPDGFQDYLLPNLLFVLQPLGHPGFLFPGILLLFFFRPADLKNKVVLFSLLTFLASSFFLAGIPYQNIRFLALTSPFAAIIFFPAFFRLVSFLPSISIKGRMVSGFLGIQLLLFSFGIKGVIQNQGFQKEVAQTVSLQPGKIIFSFSFEGAFRYYKLKKNAISIFEKRIDQCEPGAMLLIQPKVAETQWKGKNPEWNWNFFKNSCQLKVIKEWKGGWVLYEIQ